MKQLLKLVSSLVLSLNILYCNAQTKMLTMNSQVPNLLFQNIYNAPYKSISLADLKNKAVLIDFWTVRCGACVAKMPFTAALQSKFKNELQVIMVSPDSKETVDNFFANRPKLKALRLPTVTGEKELITIFPARAVPHIIWIGKDRTVKAITGGEELTTANVERLIKSEVLNLPLKKDLVDFDTEQIPLLTNGEPVLQKVITSSTLTSSIEGAPGRLGLQKIGELNKVTATNQPVLRLYAFAYRKQITLDVSVDSNRIQLPASRVNELTVNYKDRVLYSYELLCPIKGNKEENLSNVLHYMQKDLDRLFNLKSTVQKKMTSCYVFSPLRPTDQHSDEPQRIIEADDSTKYNNVPVKQVLGMIRHSWKFDLPVVYDNVSSGHITITLPNKCRSIDDVKFILDRVGYELKEEPRLIDTLVLE